MSVAKKLIRKELDRLKNAMKNAIRPAKPQWALQPLRNPPAGERRKF